MIGTQKKCADLVREFKSKGCSNCSEKRIHVIDCHHKHPGRKTAEICRLVASGKFLTLVEELKKCIPLCANCHRDLEWHRRRRFYFRSIQKQKRRTVLPEVICRCGESRYLWQRMCYNCFEKQSVSV